MERKRQREIAIAAVALVIVAVAVFRIRSTTSGSAGIGPSLAAVQTQPSSKGSPEVTEVALQTLQAERPEPVESTRNPFQFKSKPPPPPANPVPLGGSATPESVAPAPPRIPLRFIGVLDSVKTGRIAVLTDSRGVYQGREGETVEGRYRILKIGVESIDLAYLDGRGRQTIRLTGQ